MFAHHVYTEAVPEPPLDNSSNPTVLFCIQHVTQKVRFPFVQLLVMPRPSPFPAKAPLAFPSIFVEENWSKELFHGAVNRLLLTQFGIASPSRIIGFMPKPYNGRNCAIIALDHSVPRNIRGLALPTEILNAGHIIDRSIDPMATLMLEYFPQLCVLHDSSGNIYPVPDAVYSVGPAHWIARSYAYSQPRQSMYSSCGDFFFFYESYPKPKQRAEALKMHAEYNGNEATGLLRSAVFKVGESCLHVEHTDQLTLSDRDIMQKYRCSSCISLRFDNTRAYEYTCAEALRPSLLVMEYTLHTPLSAHY